MRVAWSPIHALPQGIHVAPTLLCEKVGCEQWPACRQHTSAYVSGCVSGCVSIRQHTSAYVSGCTKSAASSGPPAAAAACKSTTSCEPLARRRAGRAGLCVSIRQRMLTYADLTYADVCGRMRTYADARRRAGRAGLSSYSDVSSYSYICVRMLLYMCPHATTCVLMLLQLIQAHSIGQHTPAYVSGCTSAHKEGAAIQAPPCGHWCIR
jgi:hypothetical protein